MFWLLVHQSVPLLLVYVVTIKKLTHPTTSKVLLQHDLPHTKCLHFGNVLKGEIYHHHWFGCVFVSYNKMHNTGILSCLFRISSIEKLSLTILLSRISFEVKLIDVDTFYELIIDSMLRGLE